MSDQKLTTLPPTAVPTGADYVYIVQGGNSRKTTIEALLAALDTLDQQLDADDNPIVNFRFAGAADRYYDLDADTDSLIAAGTATLVEEHNAYYHPNLTSALQIILPDPALTPAPDAAFGIISVKLGSGGSLSIGGDVPWAWEKAGPSESDPTIPTADGSIFRLRYSYDPVAELYGVSLSHLEAVPVSSGNITYVANSVTESSLSANNRDTHSHTHTWTSSAQDGGLYGVVVFVSDGFGSVTAPGSLTEAARTPSGSSTDAHVYIGLYKPSSGDLSTGSTEFTFTKTNEIAQIVVFEVQGPTSGIAVGANAFNRNSSVRTSIPSEQLGASLDGSFMICVAGRDTLTDDPASVTVGSANGFTTLVDTSSAATGSPAYAVTYREDVAAGTYNTPSFTQTDGETSRGQMEAVVLEPA